MKIKKYLIALAFSPLLFSCGGGGGGSDTTTYSVTLNANGGTFESNQSTTKTLTGMSTLTRADCEEPTRTDYGFVGWFFDTTSSNEVQFNYKLSKNITIYAGWSSEASGEFSYVKDDKINVSKNGNIYTVTSTGSSNDENPSITFTGVLTNGQIIIDSTGATDTKIDVNLNGFKLISSTSLAPILVTSDWGKVNIIAKKGSYNCIYDNRSYSSSFEHDGAITSYSDLEIKGKGTLKINDKSSYQGYSEAIHCSKDLELSNLTCNAYGYSNVIKGNDSITITDASITAASKSGHGLKSKSTDANNSGERRGDISIIGASNLTIATAQHGITASHDLNVSSNTSGSPTISIYTSTYAKDYVSVVTPSETEKDMYLFNSFSTYADQTKYRYAVLFSDGTWENATLKKYHSSGQRISNEGPGSGTTGYYYSLSRPISNSLTGVVYVFNSNQDENSNVTGNYVAKSSNFKTSSLSSYDTVKFNTSISSTPSYGTYASMVEKDGNSDKASYGCKGLVAGNEININAGTFTIKSKDDAIHGKYGKLFEADGDLLREIGTGVVNINGDNTTINITCADDGIHATTLNIGVSGSPTINISTSYEGLEASILNYKSGLTSLYAKDDGVNGANIGCYQGSSISLNVSGGFLDIQTASGDTDGIDSNNNYNQTGGIVVSRASSSGSMSTPLDCDGTASISESGVFIGIGSQPEATITRTGGYKTNNQFTFSSGSTYKVNNTYSFKVTQSYSQYHYYLGANASAPTISK